MPKAVFVLDVFERLLEYFWGLLVQLPLQSINLISREYRRVPGSKANEISCASLLDLSFVTGSDLKEIERTNKSLDCKKVV